MFNKIAPRWITLLAALLLCAPMSPARAQSIPFDQAWKEQGFLRLFSNDYQTNGDQLGVVSNGTVSLFWRPVEGAARAATKAAWSWRVDEGVPATDLNIKGGDDRNLALYFVFLDPQTAKSITRNSARALLRNDNVRAIVYVWGGAHGRGDVLPSPYHPRLVTKVLRPAGTGQHRESVDLVQDFKDAFGEEKGVLVGLGVSADSDDTDTRVRAVVAGLTLN